MEFIYKFRHCFAIQENLVLNVGSLWSVELHFISKELKCIYLFFLRKNVFIFGS